MRAINALRIAVLVLVLTFFLCANVGAGALFGPIMWQHYVRPGIEAFLAPWAPEEAMATPIQPAPPTATPVPPAPTLVPATQELPESLVGAVPVKSNLASWPTMPAEAAAAFGGTADRYSQNEYGGWHLEEQDDLVMVTVPTGIVFEGYRDDGTPNRSIPQGGNAICFTILGAYRVPALGGTFWQQDHGLTPEQTASKLFSEQVPFREMVDCIAVGFQPVP